ncbi:MDR family MFS transporter [Sphingomonas nostoxanthinifaciens]|uniref:MDR family MFS transporter n=1 Tax=Sphingomonas nostoxanthinifaciens TaxID=2872652 RepID=UPI001CC208E7|nr:MDR family MFS transporter [Sphingomonas nostoxanthinifaciens]UAK23106.1 multidrug efflux MFS transporter [Sphingomonas nostoxanthinifaciens]
MAAAAGAGSKSRASGSAEKADAAAWMAVAAGTLGALMATLDISIVNSALPTIQGEIGASGTEGTWISTAYLIAEIIIIPLSGWLERVLGLRTLLLGTTVLFTLFSIVCGTSTNLGMMIFGRAGQGITGGALIPTAQTIIAQRLPRRQQPIGTALFGVTAIMGPVIGPVIGGWLAENISWHYAFFLNVPLCAALVILLLVGLPHEKAKLGQLAEADWLGIAGLAFGLGGMTVVLEEGQREQWFDSSLIQITTAVSVLGFICLFVGQRFAKRPVIKLSLLLDRQFGSVAVMGVFVGIALYGTSYVIPQFLSNVSGYNALQSGLVVMISGIPSLFVMAMVPILLKHVDIRIAVAMGITLLGLSAIINSHLNSLSVGHDFTDGQLMRGFGQILSFMFLSQAVVQSVPREDAGDASGLFNAMRNMGGSLALAAISILQDKRLWLHERRIEESLNANSYAVQHYVSSNGGITMAAPQLGQQIMGQAYVMTYNDIFWLMGVATLATLPLVLFLRPLSKNAKPAAVH